MERELPTIKIDNTVFIVDVDKTELRQKDNPKNTISFLDMTDLGDCYQIDYCRATKNFPPPFSYESDVTIRIPEMVKLDPEGMAIKYNCSIQEIRSKTDFDLMVDQNAYRERIAGLLPMVNIAGHTFYVDLRMGSLRPHDDFSTKGIIFNQIKDYYNEEKGVYQIPYNPTTHQFEPIDLDITSIPKHLIPIEFPSERKLDPIGYNKLHGNSLHREVKKLNLQLSFKAKEIFWSETNVPTLIKLNKQEIKQQKLEKKSNTIRQLKVPDKKKGPKLK